MRWAGVLALALITGACREAPVERRVAGSLLVEVTAPKVLGNGATIEGDERAQLQTAQKRVAATLRRDKTLDAAVALLAPPVTRDEINTFRKALTVEPVRDARLVEVIVRGEVPRAVELCNALLDAYVRAQSEDGVRVLDRCGPKVLVTKRWWN